MAPYSLARGAPDGDEEILGNDGDLVEDEEQEEIEAEEDAVDAADEREVEGEEFLVRCSMFQENRMPAMAAMPVSRTSVRLMPSAAR